MPIYEFLCESCGHVEEHLQKLTDPPPAACQECGGKMAKIMSRNSFQLKGGGWYKDLYSSASTSPKESSSTPAQSSSSAASSTPAAAPAKSDSSSSGASSAPAPSAPASSSGSNSSGSSSGST